MKKSIILALATAAAMAAGEASAGILYSTAGSVISENFDTSLPTTAPSGNTILTNGSGHIQSTATPAWSGGWKDDTTTDATFLSIPGWYLWSDVTTLTTATGGANAHVQFRYGGGAATSGTGFFAFSYPIGNEKALGLRSASPFTDSASGRRSYIGMQLVNNTGKTLDSFTITYDGEQYSEINTANAQDGFDLQWSLVANAAGWKDSASSGGFYNNGVSGVDFGGVADSFKSPVNAGTTAALNGNLPENRVADITHTVSNITWAPGAELWIRWRDQFAHDGIAIDNVRFSATAIPEPTTFLLAGAGLAAVGLMRRKMLKTRW